MGGGERPASSCRDQLPLVQSSFSNVLPMEPFTTERLGVFKGATRTSALKAPLPAQHPCFPGGKFLPQGPRGPMIQEGPPSATRHAAPGALTLSAARRSNQSILEEISLEYSLEGLMLKLKLRYFGHLIRRTDSLEKILMLRKIESKRSGR